jgi:hypothetical protein
VDIAIHIDVHIIANMVVTQTLQQRIRHSITAHNEKDRRDIMVALRVKIGFGTTEEEKPLHY